jgi:uncharacterized protein (DUF362 family)
MHYNMLLVAQKMAPCWGATVVDGHEGMEGDGPVAGTPAPHRIALASLTTWLRTGWLLSSWAPLVL